MFLLVGVSTWGYVEARDDRVSFLDPFSHIYLFILYFCFSETRSHSEALAGLELPYPPASASQVLGLKTCATTPSRK